MQFRLIAVLTIFAAAIAGCDTHTRSPHTSSNPSTAPQPVQLTDENFAREVLQSDLPVLVDMWAPWCQPCIAMKPTIQEITKELAGSVKVAELNIEEHPFIKEKYAVDRYPMLLLFDNGQEVERWIGAKSRTELLNLLDIYD
ncbi:thioredoxin family protein [Candidatus Laterigemmans baculatus]|uniref:thioredoxin family protein n=1 Tax=Candidatus Laterigemmans baculatus TaxID=2770505 RepID=UPI0013DC7466|nr:thioredoxin domain-containing protein [Candidatus Laterigemmans baculatus]